MKKDFRILFLDVKLHYFMYFIPILIIYCLFMPYCLSQTQYITDSQSKEITYFMISQRYLSIFIVYYLWLTLKNYIDGPLTEVLMSIDYGYKVKFVIYSLLGYLIILLPYFIATYFLLDNVVISILGIIFEICILSCVFYGLIIILKNSIVALGVMIIAIMLFTQVFVIEEAYILFHVSILTSHLSIYYWIEQIFIGIIMVCLGIFNEKKSKSFKVC